MGVSACDFDLTVCATTRTDSRQFDLNGCHRKAPQARRAPKAAPVAARATNSITLCCMVNLRNRPFRACNMPRRTGAIIILFCIYAGFACVHDGFLHVVHAHDTASRVISKKVPVSKGNDDASTVAAFVVNVSYPRQFFDFLKCLQHFVILVNRPRRGMDTVLPNGYRIARL